MDFEHAKTNMIKQQVRTCDVLDQRVLAAMEHIPREQFVPEKFHTMAYADMQIPLAHDQVMMAPEVEGRLLQALGVASDEAVLEIGTGTGYLTALLAKLGQHVFSLDIFPEFTQAAERRLAQMKLHNVTLVTADGSGGWPQQSPYSVIVVTGSVYQLPPAYQEQLIIGGRLFAITGDYPIMQAQVITRTAKESWSRQPLFETVIPPLLHAPKKDPFTF